ncbi:glutamate 5-kinase [Caulobacter sp. S45]|uniref:glutamate 5-kinase n=1 Tax=Caulobacter sp. S45 TaxID=1641861 RepID=UPI00131C8CF8|nr:glutamate 5-kinase [Caulobacter sp. S45]
MSALSQARRIVVKVGSALLLDPDGRVDRDWIAGLAADVAMLVGEGRKVLLVSSGSIALGRRRLGLSAGEKLDLQTKQAAASAGQSLLMRAWEEALEPHGLPAAQVLLTRDDTEVRRRWLNGRATLERLLELGAIPVVNENDAVATEEIRYGDNDRLAARVAQMIRAELLVLLSDVDGLYTADPRRNPTAQHVPLVSSLTPEIEAMAGGANSQTGVGTGGMATKLAAARIAQAAGCATLIAAGRPEGDVAALSALLAGARATFVQPSATPMAAYKQWIAGGLAPRGSLTVDAGAALALQAGKSLLPAGVRAVQGAFGKGDLVLVLEPTGREIARGLCAYDASDAQRIIGLQSQGIEAALGYPGPTALIHRDDLVVPGEPLSRTANG